MFSSWNSLKSFTIVNSFIVGLNVIKDTVCNLWNYSLPIIFIIELVSTCVLMLGFNYGTKNKKYIQQNDKQRILPLEQYPGEFKISMLSTITIKSVTHYLLLNYIDVTRDGYSILYLFVVRSFAFELIFDLIHYSLHRFMHKNKTLYQMFHKMHHKHASPSYETTFYIHPGDLFLAYSIPVTIAWFVINPSRFEFQLITIYLTYQEIGGHLGKKMYPTSSFPQFVWLPRFLGIQLYTEDHDLHHEKFKWNFSKRFTIWDKLFGTYRSSINIIEGNRF
jgi:hypothetical protein